ncbi:MAG TPA: MMPL family transporter [Solirubrobacteraceae bacterium]|jgi:RND superfamily putative drug exporter|nr:MMPL family transporter [Solirubrobacteraceae bacterium]
MSSLEQRDCAAELPVAGEPAAVNGGPIYDRSSRAHRWGVAMVRHRRAVLSLWVLALIASAALYPSLQHALGAPNYLVAGSQSALVEKLVEKRFPDVGTEDDALVFQSHSHIAPDPAYSRFIASLIATLKHERGVKGVLGPFDEEAVGQISSDEHAAVAAVALTGDSQQRFENAAHLQSIVQHAARTSGAGVQAWLTGYSPVTKDLVKVQTHDVERAEAIGLPVALLMLLIALGSLFAAFVPLLLAGVGLLLTYGALAIVIKFSHFDNFLISIVAMVGVGIGIDYALIIVSRFREELARRPLHGGDEEAQVADAVGVAIATAGRTILFSGVICGLAIISMFVLRAAVFREITVGVIAVVACTLLAALTLLPALLGLLGARIDRGALPERMQPANARAVDPDHPGGWARWALTMMRHPFPAILLATAILLFAAVPVLGLNYGLNLGVFAVAEAPSGRGEQVLAHSFAPGAVSPARIVVTGGTPGAGGTDVKAAKALTEMLEKDPRVAGVGERRSPAGSLLNVVTSVAVDSNSANRLILHIRNDLAPPLHARWGATVLAGGATGIMVDLAHETSVRFPLVLALILGLSLIFLLVVFRSPLLAFKAILMNLLATGAMLGIVVYVFQDGHGQQLFGFTSTGFIQCFVPLTVFALVYGLSMDYEVFLIRRIQEEWKRTHDNRHSVAIGVEHTARPIAAAAAIMVAVFGSFVTADLLELKQLGFAVAVGIAIDATVIRLVLVPALMRVFGTWNWWIPAWLDRILPKLEPEDPRVP